eukprot:PLAT4363.2.p1 GENE.PLAT4363.2~~PLAT4363.2.p1  ORF type:complete len:2627 (+),score=1340.38 PLAT4363.2:328-7881(+)
MVDLARLDAEDAEDMLSAEGVVFGEEGEAVTARGWLLLRAKRGWKEVFALLESRELLLFRSVQACTAWEEARAAGSNEEPNVEDRLDLAVAQAVVETEAVKLDARKTDAETAMLIQLPGRRVTLAAEVAEDTAAWLTTMERILPPGRVSLLNADDGDGDGEPGASAAAAGSSGDSGSSSTLVWDAGLQPGWLSLPYTESLVLRSDEATPLRGWVLLSCDAYSGQVLHRLFAVMWREMVLYFFKSEVDAAGFFRGTTTAMPCFAIDLETVVCVRVSSRSNLPRSGILLRTLDASWTLCVGRGGAEAYRWKDVLARLTAARLAELQRFTGDPQLKKHVSWVYPPALSLFCRSTLRAIAAAKLRPKVLRHYERRTLSALLPVSKHYSAYIAKPAYVTVPPLWATEAGGETGLLPPPPVSLPLPALGQTVELEYAGWLLVAGAAAGSSWKWRVALRWRYSLLFLFDSDEGARTFAAAAASASLPEDVLASLNLEALAGETLAFQEQWEPWMAPRDVLDMEGILSATEAEVDGVPFTTLRLRSATRSVTVAFPQRELGVQLLRAVRARVHALSLLEADEELQKDVLDVDMRSVGRRCRRLSRLIARAKLRRDGAVLGVDDATMLSRLRAHAPSQFLQPWWLRAVDYPQRDELPELADDGSDEKKRQEDKEGNKKQDKQRKKMKKNKSARNAKKVRFADSADGDGDEKHGDSGGDADGGDDDDGDGDDHAPMLGEARLGESFTVSKLLRQMSRSEQSPVAVQASPLFFLPLPSVAERSAVTARGWLHREIGHRSRHWQRCFAALWNGSLLFFFNDETHFRHFVEGHSSPRGFLDLETIVVVRGVMRLDSPVPHVRSILLQSDRSSSSIAPPSVRASTAWLQRLTAPVEKRNAALAERQGDEELQLPSTRISPLALRKASKTMLRAIRRSKRAGQSSQLPRADRVALAKLQRDLPELYVDPARFHTVAYRPQTQLWAGTPEHYAIPVPRTVAERRSGARSRGWMLMLVVGPSGDEKWKRYYFVQWRGAIVYYFADHDSASAFLSGEGGKVEAKATAAEEKKRAEAEAEAEAGAEAEVKMDDEEGGDELKAVDESDGNAVAASIVASILDGICGGDAADDSSAADASVDDASAGDAKHTEASEVEDSWDDGDDAWDGGATEEHALRSHLPDDEHLPLGYIDLEGCVSIRLFQRSSLPFSAIELLSVEQQFVLAPESLEEFTHWLHSLGTVISSQNRAIGEHLSEDELLQDASFVDPSRLDEASWQLLNLLVRSKSGLTLLNEREEKELTELAESTLLLLPPGTLLPVDNQAIAEVAAARVEVDPIEPAQELVVPLPSVLHGNHVTMSGWLFWRDRHFPGVWHRRYVALWADCMLYIFETELACSDFLTHSNCYDQPCDVVDLETIVHLSSSDWKLKHPGRSEVVQLLHASGGAYHLAFASQSVQFDWMRVLDAAIRRRLDYLSSLTGDQELRRPVGSVRPHMLSAAVVDLLGSLGASKQTFVRVSHIEDIVDFHALHRSGLYWDDAQFIVVEAHHRETAEQLASERQQRQALRKEVFIPSEGERSMEGITCAGFMWVRRGRESVTWDRVFVALFGWQLLFFRSRPDFHLFFAGGSVAQSSISGINLMHAAAVRKSVPEVMPQGMLELSTAVDSWLLAPASSSAPLRRWLYCLQEAIDTMHGSLLEALTEEEAEKRKARFGEGSESSLHSARFSSIIHHGAPGSGASGGSGGSGGSGSSLLPRASLHGAGLSGASGSGSRLRFGSGSSGSFDWSRSSMGSWDSRREKLERRKKKRRRQRRRRGLLDGDSDEDDDYADGISEEEDEGEAGESGVHSFAIVICHMPLPAADLRDAEGLPEGSWLSVGGEREGDWKRLYALVWREAHIYLFKDDDAAASFRTGSHEGLMDWIDLEQVLGLRLLPAEALQTERPVLRLMAARRSWLLQPQSHDDLLSWLTMLLPRAVERLRALAAVLPEDAGLQSHPAAFLPMGLKLRTAEALDVLRHSKLMADEAGAAELVESLQDASPPGMRPLFTLPTLLSPTELVLPQEPCASCWLDAQAGAAMPLPLPSVLPTFGSRELGWVRVESEDAWAAVRRLFAVVWHTTLMLLFDNPVVSRRYMSGDRAALPRACIDLETVVCARTVQAAGEPLQLQLHSAHGEAWLLCAELDGSDELMEWSSGLAVQLADRLSTVADVTGDDELRKPAHEVSVLALSEGSLRLFEAVRSSKLQGSAAVDEEVAAQLDKLYGFVSSSAFYNHDVHAGSMEEGEVMAVSSSSAGHSSPMRRSAAARADPSSGGGFPLPAAGVRKEADFHGLLRGPVALLTSRHDVKPRQHFVLLWRSQLLLFMHSEADAQALLAGSDVRPADWLDLRSLFTVRLSLHTAGLGIYLRRLWRHGFVLLLDDAAQLRQWAMLLQLMVSNSLELLQSETEDGELLRDVDSLRRSHLQGSTSRALSLLAQRYVAGKAVGGDDSRLLAELEALPTAGEVVWHRIEGEGEEAGGEEGKEEDDDDDCVGDGDSGDAGVP